MADTTDYELAINHDASQYELRIDGNVAGFATYRDRDGSRILPHTVVEEQYQGKGLSKPLIKFALDDIRAAGLKVVPACPAVAGYIAKNPEYKDLVG
ncbi:MULTISPECIES: GNAT family N-acetyltransferase [unclassified Corynebacterium]|uniref:GNAT family N-acetyltransferase n=1 Tax=unclassified Corynebacterium TaxID=2624378 RepID=UPI002A91BDC1|nr:GNAT family N-acetyltransferase [Corynebacterium sp.]MDY5784976.1 GNAT family N-acetyltransferase [Corynebacterium sp.]